MSQASILMTFLVLLMGAAWVGLETGMLDEQLGRTPPADAVASVDALPAT